MMFEMSKNCYWQSQHSNFNLGAYKFELDPLATGDWNINTQKNIIYTNKHL